MNKIIVAAVLHTTIRGEEQKPGDQLGVEVLGLSPGARTLTRQEDEADPAKETEKKQQRTQVEKQAGVESREPSEDRPQGGRSVQLKYIKSEEGDQ